MLFCWLFTALISFTIHPTQAQQTYVNNTQLACQNRNPIADGYVCNAAPSCRSYVTFRSQPPLYNTPSSIAALLNSDPDDITAINNISANSAAIPADNVVVVPISDCSCSGAFYQHNASYVIRSVNENYFRIANNTYEGLSTCQAMMEQNTIDYRNLLVGDNITVPLRCACPTANQTASGIRYLLTYLITWNDNVNVISETFGGVETQTILDANNISASRTIFPFTPLLIPLTTEPRRINGSAVSVPPPAPPVIPVGPAGGTGGGSSNKSVFVGVGVGVGLIVLISVSLTLFWLNRKRKIRNRNRHGNLFPAKNSTTAAATIPPSSNSWSVSSEGVRIAIDSLTVYTYAELQTATNDFSEENRVKGSVYRAIFNGDFAAVKVMKGDVSGEINILKQINHSNIIRLSGFCLHQGNTYLVYEFADNGSVSDWLHSAAKNMKYGVGLDWKQRVQIAYDVADALNYLHNFVTPPCVHKNLNSSNVLLDGNMRAKVTNFGLARTVNEPETEHENNELLLTRHVVGTYGYMPPEYIEHGLITPKMDVFALGVLISELMSGKEAATRPPSVKDVAVLRRGQLAEMVREVAGGGNVREKVAGFMDGRLKGEYPVELAGSMAEIAGKCVAADLNERPYVAEVFVSLSKILSASLDWDPSDELQHSRSLSHGR